MHALSLQPGRQAQQIAPDRTAPPASCYTVGCVLHQHPARLGSVDGCQPSGSVMSDLYDACKNDTELRRLSTSFSAILVSWICLGV